MTKRSDSYSRRGFLGKTVQVGLAGWALPSMVANAVPTAGTGPKQAYQIGIYTRPWSKHDYRVALDEIAKAGYKYVGLMTNKGGLVINCNTPLEDALRIGEEIKQRGLKCLSAYGGGIPVDKSLEAGIAGMKRLIENCVASGTANLLMGGTGNKAIYDLYYKAIAECCDYAAERNVGISIKPHGGLNATGPQVRKTVEEVGHKNFRIWYDPGNIYYYSDGKLDPVDDAPSVDGLVTGMCVKDFKPPKNVAVTPGTGMVDFPKVMAKLQAGGFKGGPLVVECLAPGDLEQTQVEAKKTLEFLNTLTGQTPAAQAHTTAPLNGL